MDIRKTVQNNWFYLQYNLWVNVFAFKATCGIADIPKWYTTNLNPSAPTADEIQLASSQRTWSLVGRNCKLWVRSWSIWRLSAWTQNFQRDRLVFLPFFVVSVFFFRRWDFLIIHRSNCSTSTWSIMYFSRNSGWTARYSDTCSTVTN